ncbi:MAG TPA: YqaJ viral recombinase family protein [Ohtaekwangia sp.]
MNEEVFFEDLLHPERAKQHIAQGTEEWDRMRIGRFTSSEMWKLLTNPRSKADQEAGKLSETALTYIQVKVAETITQKQKENSYAYPLVYGKETEPLAIEYFCEKTGFIHESIGFVPFGEHAGGSPDGIINDIDILEVKCPFAIDTQVDYLMLTDQWDLKRIFPEYYWQVQSNLLFTGKEKGHFVAYDPRYPDDKKLVHLIVKPIAEDFDRITNAIAKAVEEKLKILNLLSHA